MSAASPSPDGPERTDDGRYIIVNGRRWRASDPSIPDLLRSELVNELMSARRAVRDAGDDTETRAARDRVQDAKVALGERGAPWWEPPTAEGLATRITSTTTALLRSRTADKSICPSDVARVVGGQQWREVLDDVRARVWQMAAAGDVVITQGQQVLEQASDARGPIRIRRGSRFGGG